MSPLTPTTISPTSYVSNFPYNTTNVGHHQNQSSHFHQHQTQQQQLQHPHLSSHQNMSPLGQSPNQTMRENLLQEVENLEVRERERKRERERERERERKLKMKTTHNNRKLFKPKIMIIPCCKIHTRNWKTII